ncbi:hypothetical protein JG688_00016820 [Phytophthora aleatoria]|uniref:Arabinogalactan endo-beta-1,4-galactanase n=1 Tax=Phytophthora aleatoria TaxID=2496075 RepID=A0A8J5IIE2_9STRA|nr:hypothetical protein JG688_00016820 [Phytophthora aleatoria]
MFLKALLFVGVCIASALTSTAALTKGHDLSSVGIMEASQGAKWISTSGKTTTIESILGGGGMDTVRLRLWTSGDYNLTYTLSMAKRFSKAGYKIYLDMHFSDTISNGDYSKFATLWKAARQGVTAAVAAGTKQPKVMIHIDNGWRYSSVSAFFKGLFATGTVTTSDVDVFGFSFYPFYGVEATIDALKSSFTQIAKDYNKPLYVAETDWPVACENVTLSADYPVSAEGQTQWVTAIKDVLEGLPNDLGAGIFYWEPAYLSVASLGSSCQSALVFDVDWSNWPTTYATALSSVNMFANVLGTANMLLQTALLFGACFASMLDATAALVKGHDLSSVGLMETSQGANWISTSGNTTSIESILGAGGMDTVRLRIWTSGDYDLDYTLALAQRFSKAGYKIYLDMHFSDTWADPTDQAIPSSWDDSSVTTLAADLQAYVTSTLKSFTDGGVDLEILSLGNEITNGFLFPTGKIKDDYSNFATLWKAARQGVTDAVSAGTTQPMVMIHLDNGWKYETMSWFFKSPLTSSLTQLANTYKKPIYIAETDWPTECTKVTLSASYPVSAQGQSEWVVAVMKVLESLPSSLGAGIFYWEPAYLTVASLGSSCESALLFSVKWDNGPKAYATALSSVNMFT